MSKHDLAFEQSRITVDPSICNGKPVVRGTRITVETVLGFLGAGNTPDEILAQYPQLAAADISACLQFAADVTGHRFAVSKPD